MLTSDFDFFFFSFVFLPWSSPGCSPFLQRHLDYGLVDGNDGDTEIESEEEWLSVPQPPEPAAPAAPSVTTAPAALSSTTAPAVKTKAMHILAIEVSETFLFNYNSYSFICSDRFGRSLLAPCKQALHKQALCKQAPHKQAPCKQALHKQAPRKQAPRKQALHKQAPAPVLWQTMYLHLRCILSSRPAQAYQCGPLRWI